MRCRICVNDANPDFENVIFHEARDFANHVYEIHNDRTTKEFLEEWFEDVKDESRLRARVDEKRMMLLTMAESCDKAREFNNAQRYRVTATLLENLLKED